MSAWESSSLDDYDAPSHAILAFADPFFRLQGRATLIEETRLLYLSEPRGMAHLPCFISEPVWIQTCLISC